MTRPLISIITTVYNADSTLEATIESVLSQKKGLFEYIIIDGGSSDRSIHIIQNYEHELAEWVSEPDKGIYDAMNKGIDRATGEWLFFLGADDRLTEGILMKISEYLDPKFSAVYGKVVYDTGHGMRSTVGLRSVLENTLHHQSAFYHRSLFNEFRYNTIYRVNSDYELTLKLYLEKRLTKYIPAVIAICGSNGVSSMLSSTETNDLRSRYVKNVFLNGILSNLLNGYYTYHRTKRILKTAIMRIFKWQSFIKYLCLTL